MRIIALAPNRATVELETTDCIALAAGLNEALDHSPQSVWSALRCAFLTTAYSVYLLADDDKPRTIRHMWEMWSPRDEETDDHGPLPFDLPETDTLIIDREGGAE